MRSALLCTTAATGFAVSGGAAFAQTCNSSNIICFQHQILSPFQSLLTTTEGQALLQQALATSISIYQNATPAQQNTALINAQDPGNIGYVTGNLWQMAPSSAVSARMVGYGYNDIENTSSNIGTVFDYVGNTTNVDYFKTFFGQINIYGQAFNSNANALGDPRPFQVSTAISNNPWPNQSTSAIQNLPNGVTAVSQQTEWQELGTSPAFPSGHSVAGYTAGLLYAYIVPE